MLHVKFPMFPTMIFCSEECWKITSSQAKLLWCSYIHIAFFVTTLFKRKGILVLESDPVSHVFVM